MEKHKKIKSALMIFFVTAAAIGIACGIGFAAFYSTLWVILNLFLL